MYPTQQEIEEKMEELPNYAELEHIFKSFKQQYKQTTEKKEQKENIAELLYAVNDALNGDMVTIVNSAPHEGSSTGSFYVQSVQTIVLNGKPSIITGLHELSHHLYGTSELMACAFSIKLFSTFFPIARKKLRFKGHCLVRAS